MTPTTSGHAHNVIHRISLPIDDRPHGIDLIFDILHTAVRQPGYVDVWYYARPDGIEPVRRSFQIVGTGQQLPVHLSGHHGTAITPGGSLVWHVVENFCQHQEVAEISTMSTPPGQQRGLCEICTVAMVGDGTGWTPR